MNIKKSAFILKNLAKFFFGDIILSINISNIINNKVIAKLYFMADTK